MIRHRGGLHHREPVRLVADDVYQTAIFQQLHDLEITRRCVAVVRDAEVIERQLASGKYWRASVKALMIQSQPVARPAQRVAVVAIGRAEQQIM